MALARKRRRKASSSGCEAWPSARRSRPAGPLVAADCPSAASARPAGRPCAPAGCRRIAIGRRLRAVRGNPDANSSSWAAHFPAEHWQSVSRPTQASRFAQGPKIAALWALHPTGPLPDCAAGLGALLTLDPWPDPRVAQWPGTLCLESGEVGRPVRPTGAAAVAEAVFGRARSGARASGLSLGSRVVCGSSWGRRAGRGVARGRFGASIHGFSRAAQACGSCWRWRRLRSGRGCLARGVGVRAYELQFWSR